MIYVLILLTLILCGASKLTRFIECFPDSLFVYILPSVGGDSRGRKCWSSSSTTGVNNG